MTRPLHTRLAVAALAAPLALGLAACGQDDESAATSTGSSPRASSSTAQTTAEGNTLLTVARTGLDAVDGTLFSVDRQDSGRWEVTVVTAKGTEYDVRVSPDGAKVVGKPVEDVDDGDDRTRDRDERQRLLKADVDYTAALDAAAARAGGATATGLDLDEERGQATWEVTYGDDTPDEVTVYVDADSGKVLRTERDD